MERLSIQELHELHQQAIGLETFFKYNSSKMMTSLELKKLAFDKLEGLVARMKSLRTNDKEIERLIGSFSTLNIQDSFNTNIDTDSVQMGNCLRLLNAIVKVLKSKLIEKGAF